MEKFITVVIDGQTIANTTPHPITFQAANGTLVSVPNCGCLINAATKEVQVAPHLVTTKFLGTPEGEQLIAAIKAQHAASPNAALPLRIVGSIIAAQAYPEQVLGMTPMPGYERVAPAEKRMNPQKFTVFTK